MVVRAFSDASITVHLRDDGRKLLFWTNPWIQQGQSVQQLAPILITCIPARLVKSRTVAQGKDSITSSGEHELGLIVL
jgi:hypothetical protein